MGDCTYVNVVERDTGEPTPDPDPTPRISKRMAALGLVGVGTAWYVVGRD